MIPPVSLQDLFNDWDWNESELLCDQVTINRIVLDSLEELEFSSYEVRNCEVDMVRLLLKSCGAVPRRLVVHARHRVTSLSREAYEAIVGFCRRETSVEFYRYIAGLYGLMRERSVSNAREKNTEATPLPGHNS